MGRGEVEREEKVTGFAASALRQSLMARGRALKSGGVAPPTLLPESGGGSLQKSHGDPCCGTREARKEFR